MTSDRLATATVAPERPVHAVADGAARTEEAESRLSRFWEQHDESGRRLSSDVVRRPRQALQAVRDIRALPRLQATLSDGPSGRLLQQQLRRPMMRLLTLASSGACVLEIPRGTGQYVQGPRRQTLRRKIRAAQKHGVTTRAVVDVVEQTDLAHRLTQALRTKTDGRYRDDADQSILVGSGLWTAAFDRDGEPLVVAVTPVDGEWALLLRFISLGDSQQHSDARYLLTGAVVERLHAHAVRYLLDGRSPAELTNGLRHFQRMLGFRIARIDVRQDGRRVPTATATAQPLAA